LARRRSPYKSAKRRKELLRQKKQTEKRKKRFEKKTDEQQEIKTKEMNSSKETIKLDIIGLKSPENVLRISEVSTALKEGSTLEVLSDSPSFEEDVNLWCKIAKKKLLWIKDEENGKKRCHIHF
jgi:TusA-related sulfurtransferase